MKHTNNIDKAIRAYKKQIKQDMEELKNKIHDVMSLHDEISRYDIPDFMDKLLVAVDMDLSSINTKKYNEAVTAIANRKISAMSEMKVIKHSVYDGLKDIARQVYINDGMNDAFSAIKNRKSFERIFDVAFKMSEGKAGNITDIFDMLNVLVSQCLADAKAPCARNYHDVRGRLLTR